MLKHLAIFGGLALGWVLVLAQTTVRRVAEGLACAHACDHVPVAADLLQLRRAHCVHVHRTRRGGARRRPGRWIHGDRHVETSGDGHVVCVIFPAGRTEAEFDERDRG